ncbi:MAG: hypothetical protein L0271_27970 [Gemmatimonadetes bacterium]|nr:hypothetical protein [Gemmatimonadota bacterium]
MHEFLEWLESTPWSIALLESLYVWPLIESTHVLTLAMFVGTAIMNDLRLLGFTLKQVPVADVTGRLLRWTRGSFAVMVVTGLLIFYSNPVRYYHNIFFRLKIILLVIAGVNIWLFHGRIHTRVIEWQNDAVPPRAARVAGAVSLVAWGAIIVAGRFIAYNWFDCDIQPQPAFIKWAADCAAVAADLSATRPAR